MADFKKMIPFILHFAAGIHGPDLSLSPELMFEKARLTGWSDDPDDPGGATMIDVTYATYSSFCVRKGLPKPTPDTLREITFEDWCEILKTMFWDKWQADKIYSQGIANILVDWIWASGFKPIRRVQAILGVIPDGKVGPLTLAAINAGDSSILFRNIRDIREKHYRSCPGAWKYLKGWLRRLNAIRYDGSFKI